MRLLIQRVRQASVTVGGGTVAAVGTGLLVLAGFGAGDPERFAPGARGRENKAWTAMLGKVLDLRIFPDTGPDREDKLNSSLRDTGGELLLVPQFTLYADCRRGRRPSFQPAAPPEAARTLFDRLVADMGGLWPGRVAAGRFGADMDVSLVNWGPVTILLDSAELAGEPARPGGGGG